MFSSHATEAVRRKASVTAKATPGNTRPLSWPPPTRRRAILDPFGGVSKSHMFVSFQTTLHVASLAHNCIHVYIQHIQPLQGTLLPILVPLHIWWPTPGGRILREREEREKYVAIAPHSLSTEKYRRTDLWKHQPFCPRYCARARLFSGLCGHSEHVL